MPLETEILTTKLHRPRSSGTLVPRRRLLQRLEEQRERPLTLVCAPAGYGKTTLISTWLDEADWPSAWLSLDEGDDELGIFLSYALAAIRTLFPRAVDETLALLGAVIAPLLSVLARSLSNELDRIDQRFVLALDDYHHIQDAAIHQLLDELLIHPLRSLHLVAISRTDPPLNLSRLRARHQMTEIRTADLRFTPEETAAFIEQEMHIPLDERALGVLQQWVEGWAAGMRLIVLSLRQWGSVDLNPGRLRGHVQYVADYLASEVLKGQPQPIQDYLLSSSVLDRFTAALCDAVCLHSPGTVSEQGEQEPCSLDGQAFVAWLQEDNLFITPLDEVRDFAAQVHNVFFAVEVLALQAWLNAAQGDEATALELLERAVCLAEPGGSLRVFVDLGPRVTGKLGRLRQRGIAPDYIASVLAARAAGASREVSARQASPAEAEGLVDPLTNRESEILALLAQRLTNREIAARLFISPGTVRQHTHKLYRKLGVHDRREAVSRAQELGLLAPQRP